MIRKNRTKSKRNRNKRNTYAIVVEGETEKWYIQMLKMNEKRLLINVEPIIFKKQTLEQQFNRIHVLYEQGYDKVIWLVDFDTILNESRTTKKGQKSKLQEFKEYKQRLAKYDNVEVLINTPCLELWLLLHF